MTFPIPGSPESPIELKGRYDNYIGGKWVPPVDGAYFDDISPVTGRPLGEVARYRASGN